MGGAFLLLIEYCLWCRLHHAVHRDAALAHHISFEFSKLHADIKCCNDAKNQDNNMLAPVSWRPAVHTVWTATLTLATVPMLTYILSFYNIWICVCWFHD